MCPKCQSGFYLTLFDGSPQEQTDVFCDMDVDQGIYRVISVKVLEVKKGRRGEEESG